MKCILEDRKELLKRLIKQQEFKIISFDIFDTLLLRPALFPKDILFILAIRAKEQYGIDFIKIRYNAEEKLKHRLKKKGCLKEVTLNEIYNFIFEEYKIRKDICDYLLNEEIKLESRLLFSREDIKQLYNLAISEGKRVIAVSDMYLPGDILFEILHQKGYDKISKVYVSCDYNKRKDTGELFLTVIDNEHISRNEILHIGDNYISDFLKPIEISINAVHYPSVISLVFNENSTYSKIWNDISHIKPSSRIILGYTLNYHFSRIDNQDDLRKIFNNLSSLGFIGIGPIVFYISQCLATDSFIQNNYSTVYFNSKGGYLPALAYSIISKKVSAKKGVVLNNDCHNSTKNCKQSVKTNNKGRAVFFGSVDIGSIFEIISFIVRKKNRLFFLKRIVKKNFILNNIKEIENRLPSLKIFFHEIFSYYGKEFTGFDINSGDLNESLFKKTNQYSNQMISDLDQIYKSSLNLVRSFSEILTEDLKFIRIDDPSSLIEPLLYAFTESSYNEETLLQNIVFKDSLDNFPLSYKLLLKKQFNNVFKKTGFQNKDYYITKKYNSPDYINYRVGIHLHLFNYYLYLEIIEYLINCPVKFDLIITISDARNEEMAKQIFNQNIIVNLNKLFIKVTPNRGRDVAPWLIFTKEFQKNYDLFCHIHSKESSHYEWSYKWRKYLFDHLISANSIKEIIHLFSTDSSLGLIFPPYYHKLKDFCVNNQIDPLGEFGEENEIDRLNSRMKIKKKFEKIHVVYSGGTMLWYRPEALLPMFDLDLKIEEFQEEPIGIGGSLAHVFERMPVFICESQGYKTGIYITQDELFERYYDFHFGKKKYNLNEIINNFLLVNKRHLLTSFRNLFEVIFKPGSRRKKILSVLYKTFFK